jgi:hypothetical protein
MRRNCEAMKTKARIKKTTIKTKPDDKELFQDRLS